MSRSRCITMSSAMSARVRGNGPRGRSDVTVTEESPVLAEARWRQSPRTQFGMGSRDGEGLLEHQCKCPVTGFARA
ncbi:hypothetical protein ACFPRL_24190 [Pseudoclavibacter helvolus]